MKILSFDPSGNFKEGKGVSGVALLEDNNPYDLLQLSASKFETAEAYWAAHTQDIAIFNPNAVVIEGYRLYNHKGMKASTQSNSDLETPQLIGAIKVYCFWHNIPLHVQYAHEVKSRWADKVLIAKGYLSEDLKFKGEQTNAHKRDALRHGLHFNKYKRGYIE